MLTPIKKVVADKPIRRNKIMRGPGDWQSLDAEKRQIRWTDGHSLQGLSKEIENSLRVEASANQIEKAEDIAERPTSPINPRFRPN
jgi:hypothetical protein